MVFRRAASPVALASGPARSRLADAEGKRQTSKGKRQKIEDESGAGFHQHFCLSLFAFCLLPSVLRLDSRRAPSLLSRRKVLAPLDKILTRGSRKRRPKRK